MCSAPDAQTQLEQSQAKFYTNLQQQDATEFGEQQGVLKQMQSIYAPILAKGPNQFGFSTGETNALNTQATEGVASNFAGASRALKESQAASGGDSYLPSGVNEQQQAQVDITGAQEQSQEQQQIQQAGYAQGYNEFSQATGALENVAGQYNPDGAANSANSAGSAASSTESAIAQENESWMAPLAGAIGAVGGAATGAYIGKH